MTQVRLTRAQRGSNNCAGDVYLGKLWNVLQSLHNRTQNTSDLRVLVWNIEGCRNGVGETKIVESAGKGRLGGGGREREREREREKERERERKKNKEKKNESRTSIAPMKTTALGTFVSPKWITLEPIHMPSSCCVLCRIARCVAKSKTYSGRHVSVEVFTSLQQCRAKQTLNLPWQHRFSGLVVSDESLGQCP